MTPDEYQTRPDPEVTGLVTYYGPEGILRQCIACHAPIVSPFPSHWHLDLIKEGPREGPVETFYTPHRPNCDAPVADPQPGIAVRVKGENVTGMTTFLPAVPPGHPALLDGRIASITWTDLGWIE